MFYAARGSIPPKRHTQHRAPDGSLYAEELFGVEGFTGRSSLLYHLVPPTRTHKIEPVATDRPRGGRRRLPPPSPDRRRRDRAARRRGHRPHPAVLQLRHRHGRRPTRRRRCPTASSTATARPTRCSSSTRARASSTRSSGRSGTARATTSSCRSARPGASSPTPAPSSGCSTSSARPRSRPPKRYRNDYGQLLEHSPYSQRDIRLPDEVARRATDEGDFVVHVKMRSRLTAYHYTPPPVRRRRLGRLPVAVRVQHRRLRADHRAGPPAAAGPPDVRGAELRRVLVRAAQVRLPPARDPGAVQPLEHQLATRSSTTSRATS